MSQNRDILRSALELNNLRPEADMSIEQYLMTPESMTRQVNIMKPVLNGKKVLFLGDDDHLSVLFGRYLNVSPVVVEYDARIRRSLRDNYVKNNINNYLIEEYDARNVLPRHVNTDAFYINPPYSSKNRGKGAKVWLSRVAGAVPVGSLSVLVYPIDEGLQWTLDCTNDILQYAYDCGLMVVNIDKDIHTYDHLPKDPGLLSSNIYLYKFKDCVAKEVKDIDGGSLYR
ncbi:MAG: putative methyltransferase [Candidatus Saccharimonas sp.]|nr:MAG: putative methyltransferase [Candidatus Saccharimonas sp.]